MTLREKYTHAIQVAKGFRMEGSEDERDGKLYFHGTVNSEGELEKIWDAIKTVPDWRNDVVGTFKISAIRSTSYQGVIMPSDPCCTSSLHSSSIGSSSSSIDESSYGSYDSSSMSASSVSSSSSGLGFVSGLLAGACVGAAAALVLAPMRGNELRSKISSYTPQVKDTLSDLVSTGKCLAEDAIHQATSLIEQGRRAFSTGYSTSPSSSTSSSQPLTASVSEISGYDRRFEEPLGG